jgi:hypothetical protein
LPQNFFVGQPGSTAEYILQEFEMSAPTSSCRMISYVLKIDQSGDQEGISQPCIGSTVDCRTVILDTSQERTYHFGFFVTSNAQPGFNKLITQVLTSEISCGTEV